MSQRLLCVFLLAALAIPVLAYAGTLTMATYYPAPSGNYDILNANNISVGTANVTNRLIVSGEGNGYAYAGSSGCGAGYTGLALNGTDLAGCANYNILAGANDGNLYLNRPGNAGWIVFRLNNNTQMLLDQSGNLGIGIGHTNPAARLHISADTTASPLIIDAPGAAGGAFNNTYIKTNAQPANGWTNYPGNKTPGLMIQNNDNSRFLFMSPLDAASGVPSRVTVGGAGLNIFTDASAGTNGTLGLAVSNGNLGVGGIQTPSEALQVNGNIRNSGSITWNNGGGILNTDQNGSIELGNASAVGDTPYIDFHAGIGAIQDYNVRIINSTNNRLQIATASDGNILTVNGANVGIGDNVPAQKLTVAGNTLLTGSGSLFFNNTQNGIGTPAGNTLTFTTNNTERMRIYSTGNIYMSNRVGIGDAPNAGYQVYINGNMKLTSDIEANGFFYPSDQRLKNNVRPITHALDKVKSLNGVTFDWKKDKRHAVGLIAQNVEKVLPEIVSTNNEGMKSVAYANVVALLIESTKEQQQQIDTLKKEVAELRKKIK